MKRCIGFLVIVFFSIGVSSANPFFGTDNAPAPVQAGKPSDGIAVMQERLQGLLGDHILEWSKTNSMQALFAVLAISFLYGFIHALGPGHRKTVLFSFYLGRTAPIWEPFLTSSVLVLLHSIVSIVLLYIFRGVSGAVSAQSNTAAIYMEGITYILLIVLAVFSILHILSHMFPRIFPHRIFGFGCNETSCGCHEHTHSDDCDSHAHAGECGKTHAHSNVKECDHAHDNKSAEDDKRALLTEAGKKKALFKGQYDRISNIQWATLLLSGLFPCPAALLVMILVISLDVVGLGLVAVLCISLGMSLPIMAAAYLAWAGRAGFFYKLQANEKIVNHITSILGLISYSLLLLFCLYAAWPFMKSLVI
ncbi:nickel/cobalt transporter [Treponema phagedenis]|uniref:nickel/cobalt transporter n=1 Tax=Treponema phagedenis TaxID=162 RepID=UPI0001F63E7A|nr:nickel/cobalt transporter [Treponema phagedenis]EFW38007.1 transporter, Ni2+-Co2+ transporter (NiCoT) family protein [Treponema phagedenis F0421]TYT79169.1 nickel/cobalt transporter [Treponema phagedenis]